MTKKRCLVFSAFLTLCMTLFMILSVYQLKISFETGAAARGLAALADAYPLYTVYQVFCAVIILMLVTMFFKLIVSIFEKNALSFFALILDAAIAAFFFLLTKDIILGAQILSNLIPVAVFGVSALSVICTLLAIPSERWG